MRWWASILLASALPALADIAPVISWPVDVTRQAPYALTLRRGETVILQPVYNQDLTGASAVILRRRSVGGASVFATTGSVYSATGGVARIRLDVTDTNAVHQYEIAVASSNATLLRSYGTLTIVDSMSGEIPTTPPSGTGDTLAPSEPEGSYPNDIAPVLAWTVTPDALAPYNLQLMQGETVILQPTFNGLDFSGAAAVALRYRPTGASGWHYVAPGTIHDATGGVARVRWDSTIEGTNATYQYEIAVQSSSAMLLRAYGTITVRPSLSGSSTSMPARVKAFDWATVDHQNIGSAPFLSAVALAPFSSFWASLTNGTADLNVRSLLIDGIPIGTGGVARGSGTYTNTMINGISHTGAVSIVAGSNTTWRLVNGSWRVDVPTIAGPQGPAGTNGAPGTNVIVYVGAEVGPQGPAGVAGRDGRDGQPGQDGVIGRDGLPGITPTINIGNVTTGTTAAVTNSGSSTNVVLDIVIPPGPQGPAGPGMTNMPATWDADLVGTNQIDIKVGGMQIVRFTTNGIVVTHGTIEIFEAQLWANVEMYDGSRLAPSLFFHGHPEDWGLYARGYNGRYVAGWEVGGTEVGLLWQGGIKLMSTNYNFDGSHIGDLSGCWGYPEPLFNSWKTNMAFGGTMTFSNAVVTPGSLTIKDILNVDRVAIGSTGITVKDSGAISRAVLGTDLTIKDSLGRTISKYDAAFTYYDAFSGIAMITLGGLSYQDGFGIRWTDGLIKIDLGALNGLRFWDPYQNNLRFTVNYTGINCYNATSGTVFSVNSQTAPYTTTAWSFAVTNGGNFNMYSTTNAVTNTITMTGQTGDIRTSGRVTAANLSITNNGSITFYSTNNILLTTLTFTNGAIQAYGRTIYSTNWPTFYMTNAINGTTSVYWFVSGSVTNKTP